MTLGDAKVGSTVVVTKIENIKKHRNTISIPRFVLALDYKFNSKWILGD